MSTFHDPDALHPTEVDPATDLADLAEPDPFGSVPGEATEADALEQAREVPDETDDEYRPE